MSSGRLVLGFLPLLDCAPLIVAAERGFAAAEGLELQLVRESSWANIRDRVIVGQFDAAHMLGPMAIASSAGVGHLKVAMVAPMALGVGGNALTVSADLWQSMRAHGARLGEAPAAQGVALNSVVQERKARGAEPLTLAMVYPFSAHNYAIRYWLAACGIDPDLDVSLVVIPPPFMVDALRAGEIDGFCVGEPWNSLAVTAAAGRIVLGTSAIWRHSPDKVLGCRADWAASHPAEVTALVRALHRAACWCDEHARGEELAQLLALPQYLGPPATLMQGGLSGKLRCAPGAEPLEMPGFLRFAEHAATFPWVSHALWFYAQMVRWKQLSASAGALAAARATYRPDIYRRALQDIGVELPNADSKIEPGASALGAGAFFDGSPFDPDSHIA